MRRAICTLEFKRHRELLISFSIMMQLRALKKTLSFAIMAIGSPRHYSGLTQIKFNMYISLDRSKPLKKASQLIQTQFSRIMEKTLGVESITLPQEAPRERGHLPKRKKIDLGASGGERCRLVSVFNSLLHKHDEIVKLRVTGAKYYTVEYRHDE